MPPGLPPAPGGGYGTNQVGGGYGSGLNNVNYGPMFNALLGQSEAAAQLARSNGQVGGIDPSLINQEYGYRQGINNAGYEQNRLAYNDANRQFQGQTAQWQHRTGDIGLQRKQNNLGIKGNRFRQQGIGAQKKIAGLGAEKSRFDVNSAATAAGAYGSRGRKFNIGNIDSTLMQQLANLTSQSNVIQTDIDAAGLQDQRFAGDLRLANTQQGLNYGGFMDAGAQRGLADSLVGQNAGLLGNQMNQNLATNQNAQTNANRSNAMNQFNQQQDSFAGIMSFLQSIPGITPTQMQQALARMGR
jgi:hypothetical protein